MKSFFCYLLLVFGLCSCVAHVDKHGYMIDLSDNDFLQEGITNKENVLKAMGSPTVVSDLSADETWIYYAEDVRNFLFFLPDVVSRTIVAISFDEDNTVKELQKINLAQEDRGMNFVSDYTQVNTRKTGLFKSFFSNVGQVRPQ